MSPPHWVSSCLGMVYRPQLSCHYIVSLHRHANRIHCLFLSVLFCSSVSVASWGRQVWKNIVPKWAVPPPQSTATVETWLNNMGPASTSYLSPHMACFDSAAPNRNDMMNLEIVDSETELKRALKWTCASNHCLCFALSETVRVWDLQNGLDRTTHPEPKDWIPSSLPALFLPS